MSVRVVPCESGTSVTVRASLTHQCPYVAEIDHGYIVVTWISETATFELHALREYLYTFELEAISHEALTQRIRRELDATAGLRVTAVETAWRTAGMEITCTTSPTPARATP
jgi:NADPH-dependent 7-cyano-7-deazaguanine reductase QueF